MSFCSTLVHMFSVISGSPSFLRTFHGSQNELSIEHVNYMVSSCPIRTAFGFIWTMKNRTGDFISYDIKVKKMFPEKKIAFQFMSCLIFILYFTELITPIKPMKRKCNRWLSQLELTSGCSNHNKLNPNLKEIYKIKTNLSFASIIAS